MTHSLPQILSDSQIKEEMKNLPDWVFNHNELRADFEFTDFKAAFAFITMVALESEVHNHHPVWTNSYKKVSFRFSTHSVGNKVTNLDIHMAQFISAAAKKFQRM